MRSFSSLTFSWMASSAAGGQPPYAQQHHALNHIRIIDNCAVMQMVGSRHCPEQDSRPLGYIGDILYPKSSPLLRCVRTVGSKYPCTLLQADRAREHSFACCPVSTKLPPAFVLLLASCCSTWPMLSPQETSLLGSMTDSGTLLCRAPERGHVDDVLNRLELLFQASKPQSISIPSSRI